MPSENESRQNKTEETNVALTIEQIQSLDRASLDRMTSDAYKENFDAATNPNAAQFRARIEAIENAPRTATRVRGNVRGEEASAPTPTPGFDPSFDDSPNPPAAQPAAAVEPAAPATVDESLPELIHEYQPVDRNGRPVGGMQRFKYRTDAELIEKLTKAHSASSARIRELSRNKKLEEIVAAGPTAKNFTPSTEVPKTMEELAKELLEQRQQNFLLSVREALNAFQLSADWAKYRSHANAESVVLAISRAGDDPSDPASYQRAFVAMRDFLEPLVTATVEVPAPAPVVAQPKVAPVESTTVTRRAVGVPTGFSNADSTSDDLFVEPTKVAGVRIVMPSGKTEVLTLAAYDRLSTDVQKRILKNGSNAAAIEALTVAEDARRMAARR
jgi:hypothetical protein